ncbi:MAG: hypothetical protein QXL54_02485 [Candidatus Bathyarchaeia archaeon]
MGESANSRKFVKIKSWFLKNWKKLLFAGFLNFGFLSLIAFTDGIGYHATANITSVELIIPGHPCYGYFVKGNLTCTFNPFIYPVTYLFGYEGNLRFMRVSEPYDSTGRSVKESVEITVVFQEYSRNVPFYFLISFIVAFGFVKLIEWAQTAQKSARRENEAASMV